MAERRINLTPGQALTMGRLQRDVDVQGMRLQASLDELGRVLSGVLENAEIEAVPAGWNLQAEGDEAFLVVPVKEEEPPADPPPIPPKLDAEE